GVLLRCACLNGQTVDHASSRERRIVPTGPITGGQSFLPTLPKVPQKCLPYRGVCVTRIECQHG
ncbi:unnamed protein product, partial [Ectocarpus sp. 4 AP-2014]